MQPEDLRKLYDYNEWANARVFASLRALEPERLRARIESSFPSPLATLAHIVAAEWVWLSRWRGHSPSSVPSWLEEPELEDLRSRLAAVESERAGLLQGLSSADVEASLAYRTIDGESHEDRLLDLLLHVVNHSSYHRGQLTTMLRQLGTHPVATDYIVFLREERG